MIEDNREVRSMPGWLPALAGSVVVIALIASIPPDFGRDAGVFAYSGWRLLAGEVPLRDIWDHKPPGIYLLDAAAIALGGARHASIAFLDIATGIAVAIAASWSIRPLARPTVRLVVVLVTVATAYELERFAGMNFTEYPALVLVLVAYGAAVRHVVRRPDNYRWLIVAGLAGGSASLFKTTALAPLLAILIGVGWSERTLKDGGTIRSVSTLLGSAAIPNVLSLATYGLLGGLPALVDTNITYNRLYGAPLSLPALVGDAVTVLSEPTSLAVLSLFMVAIVSASVQRVSDGNHADSTKLVVLMVVALLAESGAVAVQGRSYAHYFVMTVGSLAMVLAWSLERLIPLARGTLFPRGLVLVLLLCLLVTRASPRLDPAQTLRTLRGDFPTLPIVAEVRRACPPDTSVYVWGAETQVNFLAQRRSASRYVYLYPLQMPGFETGRRANELLSDLRSAPPCAIVAPVGTNPLIPPLDIVERVGWQPLMSHERGAYSEAPFDGILAWIDANYEPGPSPDGWIVLRARSA